MGLVKAAKLSPYPIQLNVDGEKPQKGEMLFMAVGNNRFAGGGFAVAEFSSMEDGLLDLAAVLQGPGLDIARIKREMDDPTNSSNQNIYYRQFANFTIESENKLHCNLDGEPYLRRKLHFSVLPAHLQVAF